MTPEQRFDRLERIVKLMIIAGLGARRQTREQDQKIGIMIDAQIRNEERFAKLTESQTHIDQRLGYGETENPPLSQIRLCQFPTPSYVETEIDHVAFLHEVVLPF